MIPAPFYPNDSWFISNFVSIFMIHLSLFNSENWKKNPNEIVHVTFCFNVSNPLSNFITSILKSLVILAIWLALSGAIYSQIALFFALNCIFFSANENDYLMNIISLNESPKLESQEKWYQRGTLTLPLAQSTSIWFQWWKQRLWICVQQKVSSFLCVGFAQKEINISEHVRFRSLMCGWQENLNR